jgi:hypothetical protein
MCNEKLDELVNGDILCLNTSCDMYNIKQEGVIL